MTERTVPWWRRAFNYALEGIRSGFGLFPRPAKTEPANDHEPIAKPEENLEEETVLIHQPTNPETTTETSLSEDSPTVSSPPETIQTALDPFQFEPSPDSPSIAATESATAEEPMPSLAQGFTPDIDQAEPAEASKISEEPGFVTGHDFSRAESATVKLRTLQAAEKLNPMKGTGFSPYINPAKSMWALAPEGSLSGSSPVNPPFSAAFLAPDVSFSKISPEVPSLSETSHTASNQLPPEPSLILASASESPTAAETPDSPETSLDSLKPPSGEPNPEPSTATIIESDPIREADPTPMTAPNPAPVKEPEPVPTPSPEPIPDLPPAPEIEPEIVPVIPITDPPHNNDTKLEEPAEPPIPAAESDASTEPTPPILQPAMPPSTPLPEPPTEPEAAPPLVLTPKPLIKLETRDNEADLSPFSVVVDQVYDGPLDLLLDLIRKQDIDIYDIPISKITAQFLAYVNQLKASDVDVAGEFIYIASLLIHIKSKMLLPRSPSGPDEAAEDPRRELVERLLEHERFKNAAQMLQQKQMLEAATWTNPGFREFQDDAAAEPEIAADTVDLVRVFRDIIERARNRPVIDVEEDSVTVGQMIQFLARRLTMEDEPVALRRLLSHTRSERALIAMFLALLELVRLQAVLLRQDRQFSEIFIKKHANFDSVMNEGLANARDDWR